MAQPQKSDRQLDAVAERLEAVEDVIPRLEEQAQKLIRELSTFVSRGEDTVSRARKWLDDHPVSRGMVENSLRRVNLHQLMDEFPDRWEDMRLRAREGAERMRTDLIPEMKNRAASLRNRPVDAALIGVAAAIVAAVAIRAK